ncbi:hypothetical protein SAMN04489712_13028 [Thermomonospora echinospora]|uniref:Uncharacterized protein n=1 Tax=Thermomonospora echinospora TaxID=1992 RepID=A0A1H6E266_9ACTN|nr:hypothetical protein [Thermomonospora echinospora]SEG91710.1 hypothetical protein SAMN04489712_13028 [Thermomonospora echinospora]
MINADGTVVRSTGVTKVSKISTGAYYIELDPDINAAKAVPVISKLWTGAGTDAYVGTSSTPCGDPARNVLVFTTKAAGGFFDVPFNITVD